MVGPSDPEIVILVYPCNFAASHLPPHNTSSYTTILDYTNYHSLSEIMAQTPHYHAGYPNPGYPAQPFTPMPYQTLPPPPHPGMATPSTHMACPNPAIPGLSPPPPHFQVPGPFAHTVSLMGPPRPYHNMFTLKKPTQKTSLITKQWSSPLLVGVTPYNIADSAALVLAKQKPPSGYVLIWHTCSYLLVCIDRNERLFGGLLICHVAPLTIFINIIHETDFQFLLQIVQI